MNTLHDILYKSEQIDNLIRFSNVSPAGGGTSTLTTMILQLKEHFKTEHDVAQTDLNLDFDFISHIQRIVNQDDFLEQWYSLNDKEKTDLLHIDEKIYSIFREKLELKEFDFLFKYDASYNEKIPTEIQEWLDAPKNSRSFFHKSKIQSKDTVYKDFFNSSEVFAAIKYDNEKRKQIAIQYLNNPDLFLNSQFSWYNNLELINSDDRNIRYKYNFFQQLENQFNGYADIIKNINLPDILKNWVGQLTDTTLYEEEQKKFKKELEGKTFAEVGEIYKSIPHKYPELQKSHDLQHPFTKEGFVELKQKAQGSEFENFFNSPMTEKLSIQMPYLRSHYMFTCLKHVFMQENKKTFKP